MPESPLPHKQRLNKLIGLLTNSNSDAMVLNAGPSLKYFTGVDFHLMERPIVAMIKADGAAAIVLPEFEKGKLEHIDFELKAFTYSEDPSEWQASFTSAISALKLEESVMGVEDTSFRFLELNYMQVAAPNARFVNASSIVAGCREIKDSSEIEAMRKAAKIAESALINTIPFIKEGMSEKEIAGRLVQEMLENGSEAELPFFPIIASGPNSANPHASISERKLQKGDILLIDWGASVDGYFSDMTRTFAIGELSDELKKAHALVVAANTAGRKAVAAGVACEAVDQAGRKVINEAGFGDFFNTRTGHGLGAEVHEEPYIRDGNKKLLQEGMTFTIEPGVYFKGKGGIRIEDDVLVTKNGLESFTSYPRDLQIIG